MKKGYISVRGRFASLLLAGTAALLLPSLAAQAADQPEATDPAPDIVVTGSLIRQSSTPSPTDLVTAKDIDTRAIVNASELVRAVSANAGSESQVDSLNQTLTAGTAQFNLRNLGLGSTLVLLNGRRQTLSAVASIDGSTFVDINSLVPLIAIQRIETVKDGGAATYGSDAVAGVVNFITRKSVDGLEMNARSYFMDGARQYSIEGITGFKLGGGDLVLAGSYYGSTRLATNERAFTRARTYGRPSWHSVSSYGQPGSYYVPSQGRYVPDPDCTNAAFTDSYRNSATDAFCRFDFSDFYDVLPKEQRAQIFASYNVDLGASTKLTLEGAYAYTNSETTSSPSFPILSISPVVPAGNPYNPFGEDVLFRGRVKGAAYGPTITINRYNTFRLAAALEGRLSDDWRWTTAATYSQQTVLYDKPDTRASRLTAALNGFGGPACNASTGTAGMGGCQYFNPFGTATLDATKANSPELMSWLFGSTDMHGKSTLATVEGVVSGDLFTYAGGTVASAFGVQFRGSTFRHNWSDLVNAGDLITLGQAPDFSGDQKVYSAFGELRIPVGDRVEAQVSGRFEKYEGSFSNFSPKFSLLARPTDWLSLRGSYGKAFRAPSIYQTVAVQSSQPSVSDGGTFVFVNTQARGDPSLRPEKSTNYNLGFTVKPARLIDLSLDYYSFDYQDLIVKENPQVIINQERADTAAGLTNTPAQQRVERDSLGALRLVKINFINASAVRTKGLDVAANLGFDAGPGQLTFNAQWNHIFNYRIQIAAGQPAIEGAGNVNFNNLGRSLPRDRVEYGVGWTSGPHSLNLLGHYVSGYRNDRSGITQTHIRAWNIFDLQYSLDTEGLIGKNSKLTVGALNLFDRDPPLAQLNLGYDPIVHDPRGRVLYIAIGQKF
ncbi:iron complex outermembrane receptor protein [Sphingobium sp. OAS761]|uniref:TonB-dependent receptor domain-containing protein n=1 Tax=Sphingobium sp. OAS761 TaxID=2817901 RepID=UPI00209CC8A4|nr:TonB-dependent receptor [Sphingobium sp. OAS761]MCP1468603.1 iron complex outermembrane receptor protein [Sphingobium sp. OAS761]